MLLPRRLRPSCPCSRGARWAPARAPSSAPSPAQGLPPLCFPWGPIFLKNKKGPPQTEGVSIFCLQCDSVFCKQDSGKPEKMGF